MPHSVSTPGAAFAAPFFNAMAWLVQGLTSLALVSLVLLVTAEVALRGLFGYSLGFVEEVTGYLVVTLTLFGAALAVRSQSLFQVHVLFDAFPPGLKRGIATVFTLVAIAICVALAWKTVGLVESSWSRGKFAPTVLRTPLWIPQTVLPIGFGVIALFLCEQLANVLTGKGAK